MSAQAMPSLLGLPTPHALASGFVSKSPPATGVSAYSLASTNTSLGTILDTTLGTTMGSTLDKATAVARSSAQSAQRYVEMVAQEEWQEEKQLQDDKGRAPVHVRPAS